MAIATDTCTTISPWIWWYFANVSGHL